MKKLLLIALLIVGCGVFEDEEELSFYDLYCSQGYVELWGAYYDIESTIHLQVGGESVSGLREISGIIPSHIGCLENLTWLTLSRNELTGLIPPEVGSLANLTKLYLGDNQLTGPIPPEIGNLTNLTELTLYSNQLTGDIPQAVCGLIKSNNLDIDWILNGNNLTNTCE